MLLAYWSQSLDPGNLNNLGSEPFPSLPLKETQKSKERRMRISWMWAHWEEEQIKTLDGPPGSSYLDQVII